MVECVAASVERARNLVAYRYEMDSSKCENTHVGFCTCRLVGLRHGVTQVVDCDVSDLYAQRSKRRGLVDDCVY